MISKLNYEYVIASPATLTVWDFYATAEDATKALPEVRNKLLKDAEQALNNHAEYKHREPDYWLDQAAQYTLKATDMRVMTYAEYDQAETNQYINRPIKEITEQDYDYALNVLPPMKWGNNKNVESFFSSEFWSGVWTTQYAKIGGKFWCKLVNFYDDSTWIDYSMVPLKTDAA